MGMKRSNRLVPSLNIKTRRVPQCFQKTKQYKSKENLLWFAKTFIRTLSLPRLIIQKQIFLELEFPKIAWEPMPLQSLYGLQVGRIHTFYLYSFNWYHVLLLLLLPISTDSCLEFLQNSKGKKRFHLESSVMGMLSWGFLTQFHP
jgi:hypothetical protein